MLNDISLGAAYRDTARQSKPQQAFSLYYREPGKAGHMQTLLFADSSKAGSSRLPAQVYCLPVRPILAQLETDCSNPVIAAIL